MHDSEIRATVNGRIVEATVPNRLTLAEFLREKMKLTGTKVSCEAQVCGTCTALVDGRPISTCTTLAVDTDSCEVETIEGLADGENLHVIQQAFIDCTAMQCGFCTPGFVMATKALLDQHPKPTDGQILHGLEGNLCRCTGYLPIITAVQTAAARLAGEEPPLAAHLKRVGQPADAKPHRVVGTEVERVDARSKVTGNARYAGDQAFPDTLEGAVVRSDHAHARILEVNVKGALLVVGCVAVVTGEDLEGLYSRFGHMVPDHAILAIDKVRYFGEPVALVLATDRRTAHDAAQLVEVTYEELPTMITAEEALAPAASAIHEDTYEGDSVGSVKVRRSETYVNEAHSIDLEWGDVEEAFAQADTIVETSTRHPALYAYAMEPYNASARFVDGHLEVISTAQHPFMVVKDLARVFGLPQSRVRVTVPYIGGGYGSKSYTKIEPLAAVGAWHADRPVRVALSIDESIYTTRADAADTKVRSAFEVDGTLLARDIEVLMDTGAYVDNSAQVLQKAVNRCFGPYRIPNLRVYGRLIYTNTSPASSYRALGAFQVNLAGETNIDHAAVKLGIDAAELRERNLVARGETFMKGKRPMDADLVADLRELTSRLDIEAKDDKLQGIGFGCGANEGGAYPTSTAQIKITADGSAILLSGSTEMGQGSRTVLAQIAAEELGLELEDVRVLQADSAVVPFERTTGGSRTTTMTGAAVQRACADALERMKGMVADNTGCCPNEVTYDSGEIVDSAGQRHGYGDIIRQWFGPGAGEAFGYGVVRRAGAHEELPSFWEIGLTGVAVDVDPETGVVTVDQLVTVADVGFALNPIGVEGQDLGAAAQGIGAALTEELIYDGQQIQNSNLVDYRVPHIDDMPQRFDSVIIEREDGIGPYGSKGVGEGARIPMGGAIAAAVARSTGTWPDSLPLTPERVWNLIQQAKVSAAQDRHS